MDIKMTPDVGIKTELTKIISGIEDLFSVECNISKAPGDSRSFIEAYAFLSPNFEHKDMGEEIKKEIMALIQQI